MRQQINRRRLITRVAKEHGMKAYVGLDIINSIEKVVKDEMRMTDVSMICLPKFFNIKPHHGMIVKGLAFKYVRFIRFRIEGLENYKVRKAFKREFMEDIMCYIKTYTHYRDWKRKKKKKKYYREFYSNFK